jgi:hypothetical protein
VYDGVVTTEPAADNVTEDDKVPPSMNVPPVAAVHSPQCENVPDGTGTVTADPLMTPPDAEPHVVCWRAYDPPVASLAPVVPGDAVCRLIHDPEPA